MTKRVMILVLVALLITVSVVYAFSGSIERYLISSGGAHTQNGKYSVHAAIGQSVAGIKVNGSYKVHSGFWVGSIPRYKLFLPSIMN